MKRPILRYHGGKWRLAPWIISHFRPHHVYVEPFGGAASVLLRKWRSYAEVYNDLDGEVVNLFRVLRNPDQADELIHLISLTPFAIEEFEESYKATADPVERARRTLVRSFMGFGAAMAQSHSTGFRDNTTRAYTTPSKDWAGMPVVIRNVVERLAGVVIDNRPALDVIQRHDSPRTLFYVDPPYVPSTRSERYAGKAYAHEMTEDDHRDLAGALGKCRGDVVISGYPCDLYDLELYPGWRRIERAAHADGARERTEVLWLNYDEDQLSLF